MLPEKSIFELITKAIRKNQTVGLCIECGSISENVLPDVINDLCYHCRRHTVFGAEELMISYAPIETPKSIG